MGKQCSICKSYQSKVIAWEMFVKRSREYISRFFDEEDMRLVVGLMECSC